MNPFDASAAYYDLLYKDKDYAGEAAYVLDILAGHGCVPGSLLELGCGTGGHAGEWARHGLRVQGVDVNPHMLAQLERRKAGLAPEAAARLAAVPGDIRDVRLERTFDAVVSLFHVFSYLAEDADLRSGLETAAAHLLPGGMALFDCWHGPAVLAQGVEHRTRTLENDRIRVVRAARPVLREDAGQVDVHYAIEVRDKASGETRTFHERHQMRYLFAEHVASLAGQAGLTLVASGAWMEAAPPNPGNWAAWHLCRKA